MASHRHWIDYDDGLIATMAPPNGLICPRKPIAFLVQFCSPSSNKSSSLQPSAKRQRIQVDDNNNENDNEEKEFEWKDDQDNDDNDDDDEDYNDNDDCSNNNKKNKKKKKKSKKDNNHKAPQRRGQGLKVTKLKAPTVRHQRVYNRRGGCQQPGAICPGASPLSALHGRAAKLCVRSLARSFVRSFVRLFVVYPCIS